RRARAARAGVPGARRRAARRGARAPRAPLITPARYTLAVDPAELGGRRATAAVFGAPLELTMSWREGAAGGAAAIRRLSVAVETYSPVLEADLEDVTVGDHGGVAPGGLAIHHALE